MKNVHKKLNLTRETLKNLQSSDLANVAGGVPRSWLSACPQHTCWDCEPLVPDGGGR